ncbi:TetR family transcriptional regulator (plasmid) [Hymenobacter psoromatis]|nr:TetR family transcriptional regulator [Hymenobacter psoromatis]
MADTQQHIIEAAIRVFNEDYSAPLEKVAERAGVTRRTLHRHFAGRDELVTSCAQEMQRSCQRAMTQALDSSPDPRTQLENMLYAAIDCGAKYAFFSKLHTRPAHQHSAQDADCAGYDAVTNRCRAVMARLQSQGSISPHLTVEWVFLLFSGLISTTIDAQCAGTVARQHLKQFAWFSFSKGIGL